MWRRRAFAVALHWHELRVWHRFVRRCGVPVAQFTLARRCKPCEHWRTIGRCPSYPNYPLSCHASTPWLFCLAIQWRSSSLIFSVA